MALLVAAAFFLVFAANVVAGAFFQAAFLGDVAEMLMLALASIAFVAGILKREAAEKSRAND